MEKSPGELSSMVRPQFGPPLTQIGPYKPKRGQNTDVGRRASLRSLLRPPMSQAKTASQAKCCTNLANNDNCWLDLRHIEPSMATSARIGRIWAETRLLEQSLGKCGALGELRSSPVRCGYFQGAWRATLRQRQGSARTNSLRKGVSILRFGRTSVPST